MQELEAKYLIAAGHTPDEVLHRLLQTLAWAGFRIQPAGRRQITDVYYDTPDQALRAAGWSYRKRHDGDGATLSLKQLGRARAAIFEREEIEQRLPDDSSDVSHPPEGPVQLRLTRLLPPQADVAPLFGIHQLRTRYRITHPDHGEGRVEMSFDRAAIVTHEHVPFTELELELEHGPHELLAAVLAATDVEPALADARMSKYERGLIVAGCPLEQRRGPQPALLTPQSRWIDLALEQLMVQYRRIRLYEPYAFEGLHPEGVHQMRVATRRAQAALKLFPQVLPAAEAEAVRHDLKRLARKLGAVRDLDVHMERLARRKKKLLPAEQADLAPYETHLEALHRDAREALVQFLAGSGYVELVSDFRALLSTAARDAASAPARVGETAAAAIAPVLESVRNRAAALADHAGPKKLHRLRMSIKGLRYQLQTLELAYGDAVGEASSALEELQNRLGEHQDAWVARSRLRSFRKGHARSKRERRLLDALVRRENRRALRQRRRLPSAWQHFEAAVAGLPERL